MRRIGLSLPADTGKEMTTVSSEKLPSIAAQDIGRCKGLAKDDIQVDRLLETSKTCLLWLQQHSQSAAVFSATAYFVCCLEPTLHK